MGSLGWGFDYQCCIGLFQDAIWYLFSQVYFCGKRPPSDWLLPHSVRTLHELSHFSFQAIWYCVSAPGAGWGFTPRFRNKRLNEGVGAGFQNFLTCCAGFGRSSCAELLRSLPLAAAQGTYLWMCIGQCLKKH